MRGASRLSKAEHKSKVKKLSYLYVSLVWPFVDFQREHTKNTTRALVVELRTEDINFRFTFIYTT